LEEIFGGGIRLFLRRALGQHELENRQREVLGLVIESIKNTSIDDPNRLASCVLTALRQYTHSQMTAAPPSVPEDQSRVNAVTELLDEITAVDLEALRRYYLGRETEEQICRALDTTSSRFRALKTTVRTEIKSKWSAAPRANRKTTSAEE
jgi:hypothetical protein